MFMSGYPTQELRLTCSGMIEMHQHGSGLRFVQPRRSRSAPAVSHQSPFCEDLNWMRGKDVTGLALVLAKHTAALLQCPCEYVELPDDSDEDCQAVREMFVTAEVDIIRSIPVEWWERFDPNADL